MQNILVYGREHFAIIIKQHDDNSTFFATVFVPVICIVVANSNTHTFEQRISHFKDKCIILDRNLKTKVNENDQRKEREEKNSEYQLYGNGTNRYC